MMMRRAHPSTFAIKVGCDRPAIPPRTGSVPLHPGTDLREPQPSETVQSLPRFSRKVDVVVHLDFVLCHAGGPD